MSPLCPEACNIGHYWTLEATLCRGAVDATQLLQPGPCLNIGQSLDEEVIPSYIASQYYPPKVGGILKGQYQVVGKLGYRDVASIVWLARDMK